LKLGKRYLCQAATDPAASLSHVVANAERIEGYIAGLDQTGFERNRLVGDGVERCLERVCEAIYRLGSQAEFLMPGHPWADIRSMGNRLRHDFDRINLVIVCNTARYDLPGLMGAAQKALAILEPDNRPA
jgi:uncharacterized protein with HEPN domain